MRNPIRAFKDASFHAKLRALIWAFVGVILLAGVIVGMNAITSQAWFYNDVCHVVHADNKIAYYRSSHSRISCMACHYPTNQNAVSFMIDRADKGLFDVLPTIQKTFHMPINKDSRYALSMPDRQCVQCHDMAVRKVTPREGLRIDHSVHAEAGVNCTACHNRIAHQEAEKMMLPGNERHEDFSEMTACFRCHTLPGNEKASEFDAPGTCATCHDKGFDLTPPSHDAKTWYTKRGDSSGHAAAARAAIEGSEEARKEWASEKEHFESHEPRALAKIAYAMADYDESLKVKVPPVSTIDECSTCHTQDFCSDCHGTKVPHEVAFKAEHSKRFKLSDAASCAKCHNKSGDAKLDAQACRSCHHPQWKPAAGAWAAQHGPLIHKEGMDLVEKQCWKCHEETFCSKCHVSGARPSY